MRPEPHHVAVRLGFDEATIRRLHARGHLSRLVLTEPEIRERLYHAHVADALARTGGSGGGHVRLASLPRRASAVALEAVAWASLAPPVASPARRPSRWWARRRPSRLGGRKLHRLRAGLPVRPPQFRRTRAAPRAPLLTLVLLLAALLLPSASAAMSGDQRLLVVLATYGPRPYTVASVEQTLRRAQAFLERSSVGKMRLRSQVTGWLTALNARPRCADWTSGEQSRLDSFVAPARRAATTAVHNLSDYDRIVYVLVGSDCQFRGIAWGRSAILTEEPTEQLILHELGHTYGLAHAASAACAQTCPIDETGDPFSPMGDGLDDFSTYEKRRLGWIPEPMHVRHAGLYSLARAELKNTFPHALVVPTPSGDYWLELHKARHLVIRLVLPEAAAPPFAAPATLLTNPSKKHRPWVASGETFRVAGSFTATLDRHGVRFTLTHP
jgi:hypothetical protein